MTTLYIVATKACVLILTSSCRRSEQQALLSRKGRAMHRVCL